MGCSCSCGSKSKLIYSCSGSANTGECADRVFRKLKRDNVANGSCLVALGADISGFIQSAAGTDVNVVLDGCKVACGKKIFQKHNLPYKHYVITDFGVEKGKTDITEEIVNSISAKIAADMDRG